MRADRCGLLSQAPRGWPIAEQSCLCRAAR